MARRKRCRPCQSVRGSDSAGPGVTDRHATTDQPSDCDANQGVKDQEDLPHTRPEARSHGEAAHRNPKSVNPKIGSK